jgi:hypothetical protein
MAQMKEMDEILLQAEMPQDEKSTKLKRTKESVNEEWYGIKLLAPGPFPLKEKAKLGRISINIQNNWNEQAC